MHIIHASILFTCFQAISYQDQLQLNPSFQFSKQAPPMGPVMSQKVKWRLGSELRCFIFIGHWLVCCHWLRIFILLEPSLGKLTFFLQQNPLSPSLLLPMLRYQIQGFFFFVRINIFQSLFFLEIKIYTFWRLYGAGIIIMKNSPD